MTTTATTSEAIELTEEERELLIELIQFADSFLYKSDSRGADQLDQLGGSISDKLFAADGDAANVELTEEERDLLCSIIGFADANLSKSNSRGADRLAQFEDSLRYKLNA